MPVINKEDAWFGGKMYKRVIKVDSKGEFSCELPVKAAAELGIDAKITAKDRESLLRRFNELKAKHKQIKTTTRKVIVYELQAVASIFDSQGRVLFRADDISFAKGQVVGLAVGVFEETSTTLDDGTVNTSRHQLDSSIPREFYPENTSYAGSGRYTHVLPWTQEMENFFLHICNALHDLILKLNNLTHDHERLVGFVRSGKWPQMLEGPKPKKEKT